MEIEINEIEHGIERQPRGINIQLEAEHAKFYGLLDSLYKSSPGLLDEDDLRTDWMVRSRQ